MTFPSGLQALRLNVRSVEGSYRASVDASVVMVRPLIPVINPQLSFYGEPLSRSILNILDISLLVKIFHF